MENHMIDIALDNDGDLLIQDYDGVPISGVDQIKQNMTIRLKFFTNDWFLDIEAGIPYYEDIFIKSPNQIRVESLIVNEILNTIGVEQLLSFSSQYNNSLRKFTVKFKALIQEQVEEIEVTLP